MLYIDEHIWDFDLDESLGQLSEQRRMQALRFSHEQGRRTCVLAYLLLCRGLRQEYGIEEKPVFGYGPHGKPFIVGHPELHFSLSHCREAVACMLSPHPVGVDVESVRRYSETLARYTMNDVELSQIKESERPDVAFTRLWTMKEAVQKLSGEGITTHLRQVLDHRPSYLETFVSADQRYVWSVCADQPFTI